MSDVDRSSLPDDEAVLNATGIAAVLDTLAERIARDFGADPELCLVGIKRRGDVLARRIAEGLARRLGRAVPLGSIDITLYRDDFDSLAEELTIGATDLPFALDRRTVILVDDVLFTGRTIRAALAVLLDLGRPARIVLVALIDRGWRELPIAADLVGLTLATAHDDDVQVLLAETDGQDRVALRRGDGTHGG
jgi:pyrimidine operon attenuation protein/uracil phosphoribosyltransferase